MEWSGIMFSSSVQYSFDADQPVLTWRERGKKKNGEKIWENNGSNSSLQPAI